LDVAYKGYDQQLAKKLIQVVKDRPNIRFVFIHWGQDISVFRQGVAESGQAHQFIFLDPVGKKRLIDYYRSCDLVLDHFTYGYYGATGLEAASVGKPVLMKLRQEHYAPLYREDVAPMVNCFTPQDVQTQLLRLVDNAQLREEIGDRLRQWLVRTHGEEKTVPLMLALLRLAAENVQLPSDLVSPLLDDESEKEKAYHAACLI
jgi:glycosyltransferase involved in cell wall biosynthesis